MQTIGNKKTRLIRSQAGISRPWLLIVLLFWLLCLGAIAYNRQALFDWWQLRSYTAPSAVAKLASQDTMTGYARKIFYVNHPVVDDKRAFKTACPSNGGEQTIVLGCYHSNQAGIFLLNVTDSRLNGVEQVTAAHEMLHAAYDRLSQTEKQHVNTMLQDFYDHDLHDQRIIDTINAYKKTEPHDVVNEMHSIFGTEVADLPAPLEAHYDKYFTDRKMVAAYAADYQAEFTSRQNQVATDDAKLAALKQQINSLDADVVSKAAQISAQQKSLTALRNSGNIEAYNAGVPAYNNQIDVYNAELVRLKALIAQYNQLVTARNAIALEQDQLVKELSTPSTPINK